MRERESARSRQWAGRSYGVGSPQRKADPAESLDSREDEAATLRLPFTNTSTFNNQITNMDVIVSNRPDRANAKSSSTKKTEEKKPKVTVEYDESVTAKNVIHELAKLQPTPYAIYSMGHHLMRITHAEGEPPKLCTLPKSILRERITHACILRSPGGDGRPKKPTADLISAIYERGEWDGIKPIVGVTDTPYLRPDGSVATTQGYDELTRMVYMPDPEVYWPSVLQAPSRDDAIEAAHRLLDLIQDFPLRNRDDDGAAWLACLLTFLSRPAIEGECPMFIFSATISRTGKGLLMDLAMVIATGSRGSRTPLPDDNELGKKIITWALAGDPIIVLDNIERPLGGANLNMALTGSTFKDRLMTTMKSTGDLPARMIWLATGNNVQPKGDTSKRVIPITMNCNSERPEDRTGFKYKDLSGHALKNRRSLVTDALTIVRAYHIAGRPDTGLVMGGFEDWVRVVASAVHWIGIGNPLAAAREARKDDEDVDRIVRLLDGLDFAVNWSEEDASDSDQSQKESSTPSVNELRRIIQAEAASQRKPGTPMTSGEILALARRLPDSPIAAACREIDPILSSAGKIGTALSAINERQMNGRMVKRGKNASKSATYCVVPVDPKA